MSLPGFMRLSGSQMRLKSRKACINSGPNILGRSAPRAWPSPCSPEREPPCARAMSAARSMNSRKVRMPASLSQIEVDGACGRSPGRSGRTWGCE